LVAGVLTKTLNDQLRPCPTFRWMFRGKKRCGFAGEIGPPHEGSLFLGLMAAMLNGGNEAR
jgi:hypothetical protein